MKNQILDDVFADDFRNHLRADEEVLWEGRPTQSALSWMTLMSGVIFLFRWGETIFAPIISKRFMRYFVTTQRIIFKLKDKSYSVSYEKIKSITVYKHPLNPRNGVIFINPKSEIKFRYLNSKKEVQFSTYNLESAAVRDRLTLESIEDVDEVAKFIKMNLVDQL
ncbi:MAG: PH domain-containing protein [Bacteroidota bacterium]